MVDHLLYGRDNTDFIQILRRGFVNGGVILHSNKDFLTAIHSVPDCLYGKRAHHIKLLPYTGEQHGVTQDNYALFRQLHAAADEDMYWNSDRIFAALDSWTIFVKLYDGKAVGSVYYTAVGDGWFEIFGIDMRDNAFDKEICRSLLAAAMNEAKARGGRYMTFFCGDEEQKVADKLGFMCVGRYVCYRKQL